MVQHPSRTPSTGPRPTWAAADGGANGGAGHRLHVPLPVVDGLVQQDGGRRRLRAPVCRALNRYFARLFSPLRDRMEPAAVIPMQNPEEAVAEIDFAVGELGFKSVLLRNFAVRPVGAGGTRLDFFWKPDSPYDYDPVWEACVRNKVAPAFHSGLGAPWCIRAVRTSN